MSTFFNYLIEASLVLVLLYLPYAVFGRKSAMHNSNRIVLILSLALSAIVPIVRISLPGVTGAFSGVMLNEIIITPDSAPGLSNGLSTAEILIMGYLIISTILLINLIFTIFRNYAIVRRGKVVQKSGYYLVRTDQQTSPYSFFKYILYNPENHSSKDIDIIIRHEQEHIRHRHYLDNLLAEIMIAVFWFHPAVYLYKKSLRNIHEYQADHETMQHIDRSHYLNLLYSETLRPQQVGLTTNFSYSPLKRRLQMMITKPTKKYAGMLYFTWIPAALLLVFFLGTTHVNAQSQPADVTVSQASATDQAPPPPPPPPAPPKAEPQDKPHVFTVVEEMPKFKGGDKARIQFLVENLRYPEQARKDSIQGTVYVQFIIEENGSVTNAHILRGVNEDLDAEALRVVEMMPAWIPGKQDGKPVKVQFNLPLVFRLK